jgi:chromosome segregation ATPase
MMSEDTTRKFHPSFEERVLSEFAALNTRMDSMENRMGSMETRMDSMESRLTSLEDKVDAKLRETRPIWESVQAEVKEIAKQLDLLNRQFTRFMKDLFEVRARVERLEESQPTG